MIDINLWQAVRETNQELDIADLRLDTFKIVRHAIRPLPDARTGDHHIPVARKVFAQVRDLERRAAIARCIDDDRKLADVRTRIATRQQLRGEFADWRKLP